MEKDDTTAGRARLLPPLNAAVPGENRSLADLLFTGGDPPRPIFLKAEAAPHVKPPAIQLLGISTLRQKLIGLRKMEDALQKNPGKRSDARGLEVRDAAQVIETELERRIQHPVARGSFLNRYNW
jgi:hypothetical protein